MEAFTLAISLVILVWVLTIYLNPLKVVWLCFIFYAVSWFVSAYFQLGTFHYSGYFFLPAMLVMAIYFKLAEEKKREGEKSYE